MEEEPPLVELGSFDRNKEPNNRRVAGSFSGMGDTTGELSVVESVAVVVAVPVLFMLPCWYFPIEFSLTGGSSVVVALSSNTLRSSIVIMLVLRMFLA